MRGSVCTGGEVQDRFAQLTVVKELRFSCGIIKYGYKGLSTCFISHLHGGYFGLPGLLSTFHLLGREELHLYGPPH